MNRKALILAALVGLVLALLMADWRSDHECIRQTVQQEVPQAQVTRSERAKEGFAIFFELPAHETEELCRNLPTREGWHPLTPDMRSASARTWRTTSPGFPAAVPG